MEVQDRKIEDLENHNRAMTVPAIDTSSESTITESSVQSSISNIDLQFTKMKAAMHKMAETILSQATSVASLTKQLAKMAVEVAGQKAVGAA